MQTGLGRAKSARSGAAYDTWPDDEGVRMRATTTRVASGRLVARVVSDAASEERLTVGARRAATAGDTWRPSVVIIRSAYTRTAACCDPDDSRSQEPEKRARARS